MTAKHNSEFRVLAPLSNFNWNGKDFQIDDLCTIQKLDKMPDLSWCKKSLSEVENDELRNVTHWLSFEQSPNDRLSPSEKINIFLLSLWIVVPTKVQVYYRFEFPHESGSGQLSSSVRLLDTFQWIESQAQAQIENRHLQELEGFTDGLKTIYTNRKRLRNSLVLTSYGCTTVHWQVAFICFSAAAEGILTYEKGPGITKRLAKSFACLIKTTKDEKDSTYRAFVHSYNIRSDIMHGRVGKLALPANNLKELIRFSDLLRELWKTILLSSPIVAELEKNDTDRKVWFAKIEHGYNPPKT